MMDKRNLLKLMVLALGVSVLLFVFGYPRGEQPIDEHTIRYVIEQEPSTLDPAKSTTSPEATVQLQLFEQEPSTLDPAKSTTSGGYSSTSII